MNYETLSKEELQAELEKAQAALEDVQEERMFTLGQTGVHLGASRVESLRAQWDREEQALNEKIALIKRLLQERS